MLSICTIGHHRATTRQPNILGRADLGPSAAPWQYVGIQYTITGVIMTPVLSPQVDSTVQDFSTVFVCIVFTL